MLTDSMTNKTITTNPPPTVMKIIVFNFDICFLGFSTSADIIELSDDDKFNTDEDDSVSVVAFIIFALVIISW